MSIFTDLWKGINQPPPQKYSKLTTPSIREGFSTRGLLEGFRSIKQVAPSAALASAAPVVVASGVTRGLTSIAAPRVMQVAKTAAGNVGRYTLAHPINALKIATVGTVGGIIAGSAIKTNPKIITEGAPAAVDFLKDVGTTTGEISKSGSFGEVYGHLRDLAKEHPIASTIGAGALIAGGGVAAANLVSGVLTRQKLEEVREAIGQPSYAAEAASPSTTSGGGYAPTTTSYEIVPDTQKKKSVSTYRKRKKTKHINRSPITIRNYNIMGVSRHG